MIRRPPDCSRPATIIVGGGHSSGVGKTSVVEHILRTRPTREPWVAVKVSAHRHASDVSTAPLVEETVWPSPLTQSGRYLKAGTRRAFLCRTPDAHLPDTAECGAAVPAAVAAHGGCLDGRPVFEMDGQSRLPRLEAWLEGRLAAPRRSRSRKRAPSVMFSRGRAALRVVVQAFGREGGLRREGAAC